MSGYRTKGGRTYAFSAYQSAVGDTPAVGVWTKATFDTEEADPFSIFNLAQNKVTILEAGVYEFGGRVSFANAGTNVIARCAIYVNSVVRKEGTEHLPNSGGLPAQAITNSYIQLEIGDVVEFYIQNGVGGQTTDLGIDKTFFYGSKIT